MNCVSELFLEGLLNGKHKKRKKKKKLLRKEKDMYLLVFIY